MARWRQYALFAVWVILLASTPLWASNYIVRLAITIAMFTALTLSWNFIGGFAGYPSFSTAAFFGLGCYAGALAQRAGMPMVLAWAIATLFVGAFAAALGAIILRLRGHYFAIGSFGLRCIQQNEDAANMVGVNTTRYKIIAYTLSALFCGTVGAAYASWTGYIDPTESFSILMSIKIPVMCLLGGAGSVLGPVIGTAAFTLLEEVFWANFLDYNRAILGAVIVILIFFLPGGLLAISYRDIAARLASWSRPRKAPA